MKKNHFDAFKRMLLQKIRKSGFRVFLVIKRLENENFLAVTSCAAAAAAAAAATATQVDFYCTPCWLPSACCFSTSSCPRPRGKGWRKSRRCSSSGASSAVEEEQKVTLGRARMYCCVCACACTRAFLNTLKWNVF